MSSTCNIINEIGGLLMKPDEVKKYFGSTYAFKMKTGMSASSLSNWIEWGFVPIESQYKLQALTNSELVANWEDSRNGGGKGEVKN